MPQIKFYNWHCNNNADEDEHFRRIIKLPKINSATNDNAINKCVRSATRRSLSTATSVGTNELGKKPKTLSRISSMRSKVNNQRPDFILSNKIISDSKSKSLKSLSKDRRSHSAYVNKTPKRNGSKTNLVRQKSTPRLSTQSNSSNYINTSRLMNLYLNYVDRASEANDKKKIFTVCGRFDVIREELRQRGWIEKCSDKHLQKIRKVPLMKLLLFAAPGNEFEIAILSKLVERYEPNLIWQMRSSEVFSDEHQPYCNRIQRSPKMNFATKQGLIGCIENSHWNTIAGISEIQVPRFYSLNTKSERAEFLEDYRITYCLSLLKYFLLMKQSLFSTDGRIRSNVIEFATQKIDIALRCVENKDLNRSDLENITEWNAFFYDAHVILTGIGKIMWINLAAINRLYLLSQKLLQKAKGIWPKLESDGFNNIWIMKPGYCCRGIGIVIKRNLDDIISFALRRNHMKYVVQKYIEKPLLIYKTKFDIRQYVLLTITNDSFNIWMYKECYLRFSSQEFQLSNFENSIHLTNNAVQKNLKNGKRSPKLPKHNMWTLSQFLTYLNSKNRKDHWYTKIFPGMKRSIIGIVLASLVDTNIAPNSFEIYGCDFLLDEHYDPFLLEFNASPDMSSSTKVTAKLCPIVLSDLVKVVLDLPNNPEANTGNFQLIHSISTLTQQDNSLKKCSVAGHKAHIHRTPSVNKPIKNIIPIPKCRDWKSIREIINVPLSDEIEKINLKYKEQRKMEFLKKFPICKTLSFCRLPKKGTSISVKDANENRSCKKIAKKCRFSKSEITYI